MARVLGVVGMELETWGIAFSAQEMPASSRTVWSAFDAGTECFAPSTSAFLFNLVLDDLEAALTQVREAAPR